MDWSMLNVLRLNKFFLEISSLIILSLDPPKKDLKLAGPGANFRKSRVRVRVQKNKPFPKDPDPDPGTRHIPKNHIENSVFNGLY